jgi:hypothetical protein
MNNRRRNDNPAGLNQNYSSASARPTATGRFAGAVSH